MTTRAEFDQRQRALAAYAVAAQKVVSGIAEFFAAIRDLGGDPLEMSDLLVEAYEVLVDPEMLDAPQPERKMAPAKGVRRMYAEAAELLIETLAEHPPGLTSVEIADKIDSTTSAVNQTLRKMEKDPAYKDRFGRRQESRGEPARFVNVWHSSSIPVDP